MSQPNEVNHTVEGGTCPSQAFSLYFNKLSPKQKGMLIAFGLLSLVLMAIVIPSGLILSLGAVGQSLGQGNMMAKSMGNNYNDSAVAAAPMAEPIPEGGEAARMMVQESAPSPVVSPKGIMAGGAAEVFTPQIIKTASAQLKVKSVIEALKSLETLTNQYQGIITQQSVNLVEGQGAYRTAQFEVRIPQSKLETFLNRLDSLGDVLQKTVTGEDVSGEMVDLASTIKNKRAEEASLQEIMARKTGKVSEVLEVAQALARVRGEIEESQGRLNYLRQKVAFSTVTLNLTEQMTVAPATGKPSLDIALANAVQQALDKLYDLLLWLIQTLVWLGVFVTPILLVVCAVLWALGKGLRQLCRKSKCAQRDDDPPNTGA